MKKQKRMTVYISKDQYQELRAKLILSDKTVSGWFREIVKKFLGKKA